MATAHQLLHRRLQSRVPRRGHEAALGLLRGIHVVPRRAHVVQRGQAAGVGRRRGRRQLRRRAPVGQQWAKRASHERRAGLGHAARERGAQLQQRPGHDGGRAEARASGRWRERGGERDERGGCGK